MITDWIINAFYGVVRNIISLLPQGILSLPDITSFLQLSIFMNRWLPITEVYTIGLVYITALPWFLAFRAIEWAYKRIPLNG